MPLMRTVIALTFVAALAACNQQNAAKSEAPTDAATTESAPTEAAPASAAGDKPPTPSEAPAGATPDKPS